MRRRRVALLVASATVALAVVAMLLASGLPGRGHSSTARSAAKPARTPHRRTPAELYAAVRARAAPVAVLRRRTALRAEPSWRARKVVRLRTRTEFGSPRVLAVSTLRGRWVSVITDAIGNGRRAWLPFRAVRLVPDPWAVKADLSARRVSVYRHGRLVRRFPVAVGAPATPTPTGRFSVTDRIRMDMHGVYGCCALALTAHQPNISPGWAGGDRLAIHATQVPGSVGFPVSHGCLRAHDSDARWLIRHVWLGSLVVIRP
jgi:lipoprotein-anchoring transpeptidase ErfK/SrfK